MRRISADIFWNTPVIENPKLLMEWRKPIVFVEAPGTTPYDLMLHWHRRSLKDKNYIGFTDLLLNVRGINDHSISRQKLLPEDIVTCQIPFLQGTSLGIEKFTGPAYEAFHQRLSFARGIFSNGKHAIIRYYTEPEPEGFVFEKYEDIFFPYARLVFVERKSDMLLNLVRMIRSRQEDPQADYEIDKETIEWYAGSIKRYYHLKRLFQSKSAVLTVEDYHKGLTPLKWPDGVTVWLNLKDDAISSRFSFEYPPYKSPKNFQEVKEYFRSLLK